MSNLKAEVTLDWADGTYLFRLPVNQSIELEDKCDAPFTVVYRRLIEGGYYIKDVRETIRLGLIGGGLDPAKALTLVKRYVDERPIAESWPFARAVLGALLYGFEVEPLGNPEAAPTDESPPIASTPPASTEPRPSSAASPSRTWIGSRFGSGQQP